MPSAIRFRSRHAALAVACLSAAVAPSALGAVDNVSLLINSTVGTGGNAIGAFGYDPTTDTAFVSGFGAGQAIRKVTNVSNPALQASSVYVSEAQVQLFYRNDDPNRAVVGTPVQSSMLLNPKPIEVAPGDVRPAYSFAVISDGGNTRKPASTENDPEATKRLYTYNLQNISAGGSGTLVLSPLATVSQVWSAAGISSGTVNFSRQAAWSGDGRSVYVIDSGTAAGPGGLWKQSALGGNPVRLFAETDLNTEPAVVRKNGVDTIYFSGSATTGNANGIDYVTHDGTTTGPRQSAVTATAMREFMELPSTATVTTPSMTADAADNVYFNNTSTTGGDRRGLFMLDPQGRMIKVMGMTERTDALGSANAQTLRLQSRTVTKTGPNGTFQVTQLMFADTTTKGVAAADVYKPGDFNRDGLVTAADMDLFKSVITVRGTIQTATPANLKFDLNGNNTVDWKDVKVLQPFLDLGDGDVDLNGVVDFADFVLVRDNFDTTGKKYTLGDLTGDNAVTYADFQLLDASLGQRSTVIGAGVPTAPFDQAAYDAFKATVPEPGSVGLAAAAAFAGLLRRRRRSVAAKELSA